MSKQRVIGINFFVFALSWLLIFRLGADWELPSGFWILVGLILAADLVQCLFINFYYLKKPGLPAAVSFFALGMLLLGELVSQFHIHLFLAACLAAGAAYGLVFYCLNKRLGK